MVRGFQNQDSSSYVCISERFMHTNHTRKYINCRPARVRKPDYHVRKAVKAWDIWDWNEVGGSASICLLFWSFHQTPLPIGILRVSALTEPFEDKLTHFSRTLPKGATTAYPWLKQTVPSRVRDNYNTKRRMRVQGWIMINNFLTWWISTVPMFFWWGEKVWDRMGWGYL